MCHVINIFQTFNAIKTKTKQKQKQQISNQLTRLINWEIDKILYLKSFLRFLNKMSCI